MIIYRPHRGKLSDSLSMAREFESEEALISWVVADWNTGSKIWFDKSDVELYSVPPMDESNHCGWADTRFVCVRRMGDEDYMEMYGCPQCIGMWATEYET